MLPSRFTAGPSSSSSALRKSRLEGKPSLLPRLRRPGSTDRLSTEARRPSTTGHRSSSAEPRSTFGGGRLSREASATNLKSAKNERSRSQQGDKFVTPLRSSQYSIRPTTTPRTPSEDRANRNWQTALDRALAFVTIKDQRPISNVAWQRAEMARVQEALAARGGGDGAMALIRPLTIARFVAITGALLSAILKEAKLNNDNYVTKLPHLSKRLLYPGTVSKSWLKTVNTLHAFPQALALIAYLLDLVNHIEMPVSVEWLYSNKDDLSCLRRDFLSKCWIRFQDPGSQFDDLTEEYLHNLTLLLGNNDEKIIELKQDIAKLESTLEDSAGAESAARAEEECLATRRDALRGAVRAARGARAGGRAACGALRAKRQDLADRLRQLDAEIERANAKNQQLSQELESQTMTVEERNRLLDEVDYANRVLDSKQTLAEQIAKMIQSKETELALWQNKTLDSCVEYKRGLLKLSAEYPDLASLAIDEKELMGEECAGRVSQAVEELRERASALAATRAGALRDKGARARRRAVLEEETRAKIAEAKSDIKRTQEALESERAREAAAAAAWGSERSELVAGAERLRGLRGGYDATSKELDFWEKQDHSWRTKLASMREYIETQRVESKRLLEEGRARRVQLFVDNIKKINEKLCEVN